MSVISINILQLSIAVNECSGTGMVSVGGRKKNLFASSPPFNLCLRSSAITLGTTKQPHGCWKPDPMQAEVEHPQATSREAQTRDSKPCWRCYYTTSPIIIILWNYSIYQSIKLLFLFFWDFFFFNLNSAKCLCCLVAVSSSV